ncbi:MAG: hypothetical protein E7257_03085 [Lachnospiraceae bacterium]|nr:hypothetical protein [Lachnospiraceae bacterium]
MEAEQKTNIPVNGKKRYLSDLIYSILGLVVMNGVIQMVLYPYLNKQMGEERFGDVLSLISIVAIMGTTFGTAANYSRVVSTTKRKVENGDYNIFLTIIAVLSVIVSLATMLIMKDFTLWGYLGFSVLMIFTVLRYYADVEFRLNVNYKRFFIFYLFISIGYLLGVLVYPATKSWIVTMLLGEIISVVYVLAVGKIFRGSYVQKSEDFKENMKSVVLLSGTNLISALILNVDRLMLQYFEGGTAVTIFYTATLVGKIVALVSGPLNGVIIGHLAKYKGGLPAKKFVGICGGATLFGLIINVACVAVSYVFVKLMYPDVFDMAKPYFWIANAGQVFYFISGTLTVILLRFTDEKYQLYINIAYLLAFLIFAFPMVISWGIWGMAIALLIVNLLRIILIAVMGIKLLKIGG